MSDQIANLRALRYFRGDRPSQTTHQTPSRNPGLRVHVRTSNIKRVVASLSAPCRLASTLQKPPTYPTHQVLNVQCQAIVKVHGSSVLPRVHCIFHSEFNFTESRVETASPPHIAGRNYPTRNFATLDRYKLRPPLLTGASIRELRLRDLITNLPAPGRRHTVYVHCVCTVLCFLIKQLQPAGYLRPTSAHE